MLPKENRLKEKDVKRVLKDGQAFKEDFLILRIVKNNLNKTRFGFIVSKKLSKKATMRNKIRRRLSNLVKVKMKKLKKGVDGIFIAVPGLETKDFWEIEEAMNKNFSKAKLLND